jgi:hypothetical protein
VFDTDAKTAKGRVSALLACRRHLNRRDNTPVNAALA